MPLPSPHRTFDLCSKSDTAGATALLQPEELEKERLQEIRRMPLPPSRGTFDLGSSVDTDQLITLNRKVKADGGTLHCIVLSLEPSQVHGPNQSFDTSLIASRLQDVYHEVRDTPSQQVHLDLANIDAVISAHAAATLPYPKAEKLVERLLFDPLSMEHRRCKTEPRQVGWREN